MVKTTVVQQTALHLQRELNRLESEKEKVRKALAAVQAIFGSGEGIRAARSPRRLPKSIKVSPKETEKQRATRAVAVAIHKVRERAKHRQHHGPEKTCPLCHQSFRAYKRDQIFCGRRSSCKSNSRAAVAWRAEQRKKEEAKKEKRGTTLIPGDPLSAAHSNA